MIAYLSSKRGLAYLRLSSVIVTFPTQEGTLSYQQVVSYRNGMLRCLAEYTDKHTEFVDIDLNSVCNSMRLSPELFGQITEIRIDTQLQ